MSCHRDAVLTQGKAYLVTFTLVSRTSGSYQIVLGGTQGTFRNTLGTYTETIICGATAGRARIQSAADGIATIDNWTVQEIIEHPVGGNHLIAADVLQGHGDFAIDGDSYFTIPAGWVISTGSAQFNSASAVNLSVTNKLIAGKTYRIEFQLLAVTGNGVQPSIGGVTGTTRNTIGIWSEYITAGTSNASLVGKAGATATVDGWTIREVFDGNIGPDGVNFNGISNCLQTTKSVDLTITQKITVLAEVKFNNYSTTAITVFIEGTPLPAGTTLGTIALSGQGTTLNDPIRSIVWGNAGAATSEYYNSTFGWSRGLSHILAFVNDMTQAASNEPVLFRDGSVLPPSSHTFTNNNTGFFGDFVLYFGGRGGTSLFSDVRMKNIAIFTRILSSEEIADYTAWQRDDRSPRPFSLFTGGPGQYQQLLRRRSS